MNSEIYIPKRINVGFQNRDDTYTKKLAYIIYYDEKGKLHKETSWKNWRDENIPNEEFDNIPIEGFVLNKKVGDYSSGWNHRQAYCRIYDPRNFEFEITIENLLYILENTNCIKGKGLEGEFVYGWSGKDLILLPVSSPDYEKIQKFTTIVNEDKKIKAKDLIIGATYLTRKNEEYIYMGRFDYYDGYLYSCKYENYYWFAYKDEKFRYRFKQYKSISSIISCISEECVHNYADIFFEMEGSYNYSPCDKSKDEFVEYTLDEFKESLKTFYFSFISNISGNCKTYHLEKDKFGGYEIYGMNYKNLSIEEIFEKMRPGYIQKYLANGRPYKKVVYI